VDWVTLQLLTVKDTSMPALPLRLLYAFGRLLPGLLLAAYADAAVMPFTGSLTVVEGGFQRYLPSRLQVPEPEQRTSLGRT